MCYIFFKKIIDRGLQNQCSRGSYRTQNFFRHSKLSTSPTTFRPLPRVGRRPIRDAERYVWHGRLHSSHTYRRPREGLARIAGWRAGQGRSRPGVRKGGGRGAAAPPKGSCTLPQRQMCYIPLSLFLIPPLFHNSFDRPRWALHTKQYTNYHLKHPVTLKCVISL